MKSVGQLYLRQASALSDKTLCNCPIQILFNVSQTHFAGVSVFATVAQYS